MRCMMNSQTRQLYLFLSACSGNWRNTIYISDPQGTPSYLLAADRDGKPVVMAVEQFQQLSGERIDFTECRGQLTRSAFEDVFAQYLLWQISDDKVDTLTKLSHLEH